MSRQPGSQARLEPFDAVVLAGGRARRLHGADKPGLDVGGRSLVAWVGEAVADAGQLVLVGPARPELPHAVVVREDPPGSGPIPALGAGLARVRAMWVAVLAADLPFLRSRQVAELRRQAAGVAGAILVDDGGRPQWLAGVWRTAALRTALSSYEGTSLRGLFDPLAPRPVIVPPGERPPWYDCDTPADVEKSRRIWAD